MVREIRERRRGGEVCLDEMLLASDRQGSYLLLVCGLPRSHNSYHCDTSFDVYWKQAQPHHSRVGVGTPPVRYPATDPDNSITIHPGQSTIDDFLGDAS